MSRLAEEIREEAARARSEPAPELTFGLWRRFADTGDRLGYENVYFDRRRRLVALALAAHLDDRADPALDDLLWSVCDERSWVLPAHEPADRPVNEFVDLFSAETGHTLAEAVSLLGDRVDARVRERVRAVVDRRVLRPLYGDPRPMWWESAAHNWAAVCAGAAGMAALALDSEHLPALLPRVEAALGAFLSGAGADGACLEGPDYWTYGFGYFVYFAEALRARTGADLLDTPHVRRMAAYPAAIDLGGGFRPAFADSRPTGGYPPGLLDRLAGRLGVPLPERGAEPSFHDDACYRWAHLSRNLWWATGAARAPAGTHSFLPDAAIVVGRAAGMSFAAKGGHNDEPHNHLDLGHFVLHVDGETVLDDLGAPEYTRDYFRDGRYDVPHASAEWHSVPLIDGTAQRPGRDSRAEVVAYDVGPGPFDVGSESLATAPGALGVRPEPLDGGPESLAFALDLTAAYDTPVLGRFVRAFDWCRGRLAVTDTFDLTVAECRVEELFVSRRRPELLSGTVRWGAVELLVPGGWRAEAEELAVRDHHGAAETVHRVRLTARISSGAHRFVFTVSRRVRGG